MKVKEVAKLVGISVRTLHHYDNLELLISEKTTSSIRTTTQNAP